MTGAALRPAQDVASVPLDLGGRPEQRRRVEVALDGDVVAELAASAVEIDAPVEADDVAAGGVHLGEHAGAAPDEVDQWRAVTAQRFEHLAAVRRREALVVGGREGAGPGVEELQNLGACLDLGEQVGDRGVGQQIHEPGEGGRLGEHQPLDLGVGARVAALDHIAGQGEGGAGEADQRYAAGELAGRQAQRLEDEGHVAARVADVHALQIGGAAHRALDHRPVVSVEMKADAHALERQQDVGEDDGAVEIEAGKRLERDLDRHLGPAAELDEAQLLAQGTVFGQVASGLAHEPDRCGVDGLAEARVEQQSRRHVGRLFRREGPHPEARPYCRPNDKPAGAGPGRAVTREAGNPRRAPLADRCDIPTRDEP